MSKIVNLKIRLHFENAMVMDIVGKAGGLVLFWKYDVNVVVHQEVLNTIHCRVRCAD